MASFLMRNSLHRIFGISTKIPTVHLAAGALTNTINVQVGEFPLKNHGFFDTFSLQVGSNVWCTFCLVMFSNTNECSEDYKISRKIV